MLDVKNHQSEVSEIMAAANKANAIMRLVENEYSILDTANPSEAERSLYARECDIICVLIEVVHECVDKILAAVDPMMMEV